MRAGLILTGVRGHTYQRQIKGESDFSGFVAADFHRRQTFPSLKTFLLFQSGS
jgi:hypothetical protein